MARDEVRFPDVLFLQAASRPPGKEAWQPRADVHRVPGGWLVKLELAGIRMADVHLVTRDARLIVQGMRRDECACVGRDCHRLEIAYSRFERILELPGMSEAVEITSSYLDGMLTVRILTERQS
jgi:HSP20 family protein